MDKLEKVSQIKQKYKDIVVGFLKQSQALLPRDNAYCNNVHDI